MCSLLGSKTGTRSAGNDSQVSAARRADESVGDHVGVGGPALLALETLFVVRECRQLPERL